MNTLANADMNEFWNGAGGEKWLRFQDTMDINLKPFGHKAITAANILPGETVLDIGCGCGDTTFELARLVGSSGQVLGLDISQPLLARAEALSESTAEKNIMFKCGDAQEFAFAESTFDLLFSRFGVMFFDNPVTAFSNLQKSLKPGGRLTFICWQPLMKNEWVKTSLKVVARHISLPAPSGPEEPGPMSFGDPKRVARILKASGFSDICINACDTAFTVGRDLDEAVAFLTQMGPAAAAISQSEVDEKEKVKIARDMQQTLQQFATKAGITLSAATWIVSAKRDS